MKGNGGGVWVSHRPRLLTPHGGNTPHIRGGVNEKKWRQHVGIMPPLFEMKRNWLPPPSTPLDMPEMEWWVGIPLLHH